MRPIAPVIEFARKTEQVSPAEAAAKPDARSVSDPALARASREFEGVFTRQLLEASGIGKSMGKGGHGAMAIDALATSSTEGGGLGLARAIEQALAKG